MNLVRLLFPHSCELCGRISDQLEFGSICRSCYSELSPIAETRCLKCGRPLISEIDICTACRNREYTFINNVPVFEYYGTLRRLIHLYKFKGKQALAALFASFLSLHYYALFYPLPVVPVPGRKRNSYKKRWNHLEKILTIMHRHYSVEALDVLKRSGSKAQKSLSYEERMVNLKGSISIRKNSFKSPESVVLLDDVFTTGATVEECTRVLRKNGILNVYVMTLAID